MNDLTTSISKVFRLRFQAFPIGHQPDDEFRQQLVDLFNQIIIGHQLGGSFGQRVVGFFLMDDRLQKNPYTHKR